MNLVDKYSVEIVENGNHTLLPNITCSLDGSTDITHTLVDGSDSVPTWVSINSDSSISAQTPSVKSNTTFSFKVESTVSSEGYTYSMDVELLVFPWEVQNWKICSISNPKTQWDEWKTEFTLDSTTKAWSANSGYEETSTVAQATIGAIVVVTSLSSLLSGASLQSLWSLVNIIQLTMLLPLTQAFIPQPVIEYLTGMAFLNFNFAFIPLSDIPIVVDLDFEVYSGYVNDIGVQSASTFVNHILVILLLIMIVIWHSLLAWMQKITESKKKKKWYNKLLNKIIDALTFGVYIRIFIESFQIMLISSLYEIKHFRTKNALYIISLVYAFIVLMLSVGLLLLMLTEWLRSKTPRTFQKQKYFKELFNGVKPQWFSRSFTLFNFWRRTLLILWVTFLTMNKGLNIGMFVGIQVLYFILIVVMRPLERVVDNIVEVFNEMWFSILWLGLTYLNSEDDWTKDFEKTYYYILFTNTLIVSLILTCKFI